MLPLRLHIENFGCHGMSEINFNDFQSAVVIGKMRGNDKFANGSGKSTISVAIKFVLFNKVDTPTFEGSIRRGADYLKVEFDFKSNNETYRIVRSRFRKAPPDVRLFRLNGDIWEDITQRTSSQTEAEITKIIKMNYEVFNNSALFSQTDLYGIASLTPSQRKTALKEALQLKVYGKLADIAKKKSTELSKELDKVKTIISTFGDPSTDITSITSQIKSLDDQIQVKTNSINAYKTAQKIDNDTLTNLTTQLAVVEQQAQEYSSKHSALRDDLTKLSSASNDYSKKTAAVESSGKSISEEVKSINDSIKKLSSSKFDDLESLKIKLSSILSSVVDSQTEVKLLSASLEELLTPLPNDTKCKHCRQILSKQHIEECKTSIANQVESTKIAIHKAKAALDKFKAEYTDTNRRILAIEQAKTELISKQNTLTLKEKELENKRAMYEEYYELQRKYSHTLKQKSQQLKELEASKSNEAFNTLQSKIVDVRQSISKTQRSIDMLDKEITQLSSAKTIATHKLEESNKALTSILELKATLISLSNKYSINEKVVQAFGPAGIPALITHTILDDFQIETNALLSQLRPGLQLQFSIIKDRTDGDKEDTLDITYILNGYDDMEYENLSGAQKLIVSLCLKLGLASVVKRRLGVDIQLLFIDEVDQSFDQATIETFEQAIKKLQKEYKVIVITHNNDLKEKFSHAILVEQDDRFVSSAKVVNQW